MISTTKTMAPTMTATFMPLKPLRSPCRGKRKPVGRIILSVMALGLGVGGCGDDAPADPDGGADAAMIDAGADASVVDGGADAAGDDAATTASMMIGPAGGTLELPGEVTLEFPPGTVDADTMITVSTSTTAAPQGALTPLYEFEPDGMVFAHPVVITLALPGGVTDADVYWSRLGGTGHDNVGGVVDGSIIRAEVVHFSTGYAGPGETSRTVTGSQVVTWTSASGIKNVANDLSAFAVSALIEDGQGGYATIAGTGNADGTFIIENVPDGPYWLRLPGQYAALAYYRTSASTVDAGFALQGRPDAVPVTTSPTNLVFNVAGLAPWQAGDNLELFSTEVGAWRFNLEFEATAGAPQVDDTALTGLTIDMSVSYPPMPANLIDGSHSPPDRLVLGQLASRTTTTGIPYKPMSRIFEPAPFTQTDGVTTTVTGTFADVSLDASISLDVKATAFAAANAAQGAPCAYPNWWLPEFYVYVLGKDGGLEYGITGATADFLGMNLPLDQADFLAPNMSYGSPVVGTWGHYGLARYGQFCTYFAPGATNPAALTRGFDAMEDLTGFSADPVEPKLGLVTAPTINSLDLYSARTGVGETPTIAWTAPTIGTASQYRVEIIRLSLNGIDTAQETVASLASDQTSVTVPPGILVVGDTYVLRIIARSTALADPSAKPNREALPEHTAVILTELFTP